MAANAGASPDLVQDAVLAMESFEGYNFSNGETVNMVQEGIIDPVKVTRSALQNAASAAGTLMTTNYAIIQVE